MLEKNAAKFPKIETFDVEELIGPWPEVQKTHFDSDGIFDSIVAAKN